MALADIALRGKYNRLLGRFEASLQTISALAARTAAVGQQTFADRAAFFASDGNFYFAWLNNAVGSDGIASFWSRADGSALAANSSDTQSIGGHIFIQLYVRENIS